MHFLELTLQNFGPYHKRQIINLQTQPESPIILFGGMNGGGKTTLMDAIRLALYGQRAKCSTRGSLSYGDFLWQCRNRQTPLAELSCVELVIEEIIEGKPKQYRIRRSWDDNTKNNRDTLEILDGIWKDEALTQTWDEYIEKLLPLGISSLFLFDGEQVKELAEQDEPTADIVQAMRTLLGLELANTLNRDLDILIARKSKAIAENDHRQKLEDLEAEVKAAQDQQTETYSQKATLQPKLDRAKEELRQAQERFYTEGGKIAAQQTQLHQTLAEYRQQWQHYQTELLKLAPQLLPLALIQPLLNQALTQGQTEQEHQTHAIAANLLEEQCQRFANFLEQLQLNQQQQEQAQIYLAQEQTPVPQLEPWLDSDRATLNQLDSILHHGLELQRNHSQQLLDNLSDYQQKIDDTERLLATAASPEAYDKLVNQLHTAQRKYDNLTRELQTLEQNHEQSQQIVKQATQSLQNYTESIIEQQQNTHFLKSASTVQKTLSIFSDRLKRHKLNQLEIQITKSFGYLLHKTNLIHRIEIDGQTFALKLYDQAGQLVPKHRLSAGEKQLLAIALLWGLGRASGRQLPIAIDTPLGRLDSSHRANLVERYFPEASHQVLLLSTDTEIAESEVNKLRDNTAISHEYLLKYDSQNQQTKIESGYFW
jgi:DNA sulfur modification protein DndD